MELKYTLKVQCDAAITHLTTDVLYDVRSLD